MVIVQAVDLLTRYCRSLVSYEHKISNLGNIAETFRCTYCNTEVEEDASALPKHDARTLLAKFNEQIEPIFVLLRETEDIVLPYHLLEPQPMEIPELSERYKHNPRTSDQDKAPSNFPVVKSLKY